MTKNASEKPAKSVKKTATAKPMKKTAAAKLAETAVPAKRKAGPPALKQEGQLELKEQNLPRVREVSLPEKRVDRVPEVKENLLPEVAPAAAKAEETRTKPGKPGMQANQAKDGKVKIKGAMPLAAAISALSSLVSGLGKGEAAIAGGGGETLLLRPSPVVEIAIKAERKKDEEAIKIEVAWRRGSKRP